MSFDLVPLGSLAAFINGDRGENYPKPSDYIAEGIPFLSATDIDEGKIAWNEAKKISPGSYSKLRSGQVRRGDILFCLRGSLGKFGYVENDLEGAIASSLVILRAGSESVARYLRFFLGSADAQSEIKSLDNGSVQGNISAAALKGLLVPSPPEHIRASITTVLESLDGRIDNNRRINQTLEAMAQAIFKSWFVDFDPVKAKIAAIEQGQDPLRAAMRAISGKTDAELDQMPREHHDQLAATAALFPDAMEESELGEIPEGWRPTPIRDVAGVVKGKSYSSKDLVDNDQAALVTLKSFERGGGFRMDGFKPYVGPYKPEQVVLPGDLIVAYTDVTQAAELIGKPAVVVGVNHFKTLVASLDVGIVRPLNERVSRQFLYGLFMTDAFQSHSFAHTSGTTVLHLAKEAVPSYLFACPDEQLVGFFSEAAEAMAMEKQRLLDQNRSLATLRDTLLPKLLSGELSVADLEVPA